MRLHYFKIIVLAVIASYFSMIAFNNITNFSTNYWGVKTVLGMEGIDIPEVEWRGIKDEMVVSIVYGFIIATEVLIATLCWISAMMLLMKQKGQLLGLIGLTGAFLLFMFGFVVIAGEWFFMWKHPILAHLYQKAFVISIFMLVSIVVVQLEEQAV